MTASISNIKNHEDVSIEINLLQRNSQLLKVSIKCKPKSNLQELILPVWTPGSYKVRDHSQHLFDITLKQVKKMSHYQGLKLINGLHI